MHRERGMLLPTKYVCSSLLNQSDDPDYSFHCDDIKILESGRYDQEIRFTFRESILKYDKQNLNTYEKIIQLEIV